MKEEEKQQEKEDEAEVKEEIPGSNPEDESSRTCYIGQWMQLEWVASVSR